jgi:hypothetical protein
MKQLFLAALTLCGLSAQASDVTTHMASILTDNRVVEFIEKNTPDTDGSSNSFKGIQFSDNQLQTVGITMFDLLFNRTEITSRSVKSLKCVAVVTENSISGPKIDISEMSCVAKP